MANATIPGGGGGGAPKTATYLLQTANAKLPNAQAMGALATGLVKNTTVTGVQSIATGADIITAFGNQTANLIFAGPASGAAAAPTFRAIVPLDLTTALTTPPAIGGTTPAAGTFTTLGGTIITASTRFVGPIIAPASDSTTAWKVTKADGSTAIVTVDTTNSRVGIGHTPNYIFDVHAGTDANVVVRPATVLSVANGIFLDSLNDANNARLPFVISGSPLALLGQASFGVKMGINFTITAALSAVQIHIGDSATTSVTNVLSISHLGGTPGVGFGTGIILYGDTNGAADKAMGRVRTTWTNATNLSQTSSMSLSVFNVAAEVDVLTLAPTGSVLTVIGRSAFGVTNQVLILPDYVGSNDLPVGALVGTRSTGNFSFFPSIDSVTAGLKVVLGYWSTATGGRSAVEVANVASGNGTLTLMKNGGVVVLAGGILAPAADSTTALKLTKANGTTAIVTVDTTNTVVTLTATDTATATVTNALVVDHSTSGGPVTGYGTGVLIRGQSSTTANQSMTDIQASWVVATHASRTARVIHNVYDTAAREVLRFEASGSAAMIGVLGATASLQQTSGANLTNNVTSGGTDDTIANYTDLIIYANDAAAIRNDIYQLARKLKQLNDGLRLFGWFT